MRPECYDAEAQRRAWTRVTVEWPGGEAHTDTDDDGWFRLCLCGIPAGKLLLVKAPGDAGLATSAITLDRGEIVRQLMLRLAR